MGVTLGPGGGRGRGGPVAWLLVAALVCAGIAYFAGFIQTLGYETRHETYAGLITSSESSSGFGLKTMVFFEGQTFFASYDAEVRQGSLRIGLLETFGSLGNSPHFVENITRSGSGEVTFQIPKTGLYSAYFEGSVLGTGQGGGYDVAYSLRWGAR